MIVLVDEDGTETRYVMAPEVEIESTAGPGHLEIRARYAGSQHWVSEPVNKCDCCGRADMAPVVCRSWEEAVERGWLRPAGGSDE